MGVVVVKLVEINHFGNDRSGFGRKIPSKACTDDTLTRGSGDGELGRYVRDHGEFVVIVLDRMRFLERIKGSSYEICGDEIQRTGFDWERKVGIDVELDGIDDLVGLLRERKGVSDVSLFSLSGRQSLTWMGK